MTRPRRIPQTLIISALLAFGVETAQGQATALPTGDVHAIYTRLLAEIQRIPIFDHHAHPGFGDDPDVDAEATPPEHLPLRERESNPEFVVAVKALFNYPYADMTEAHVRWLADKSSSFAEACWWHRILRQRSG